MAKMTLTHSIRSPFVRKVMITLHETDQLEDVDLVPSLVALTRPPAPEMLDVTPLGKIPALQTSEGEKILDSRSICEYLDARANGGLFPAEMAARLPHLRWMSMGDGLTDILLIWRTELTRPTGPWQTVTEGWRLKAEAILTALEAEAENISKAPFGIGHIALVCAFGQLDFRWPDCDWRAHFPRLAALCETWNERDSVRLTQPPFDPKSDENTVTAGQLTFMKKTKS